MLNKNLFIPAITALFIANITGCGSDSEPPTLSTEKNSAIERDATSVTSPTNTKEEAATEKAATTSAEESAESADMSSILSSINAANSNTPIKDKEPVKPAPTTKKMADRAKPHFSYSGATGPIHWGELDAAWATCKAGNRSAVVDKNVAHQSPIDFAGDAKLITLTLTGADSGLNFSRKNNGHTIQLDEKDTAGAISIELKNVTYTLAQFHFHAGSEHQDHSQQSAMEVHFVFANEDNFNPRYAVVGLFIDQGENNPALAKALSAVLPAANQTDSATINIAVANILNDSGKAYRYTGSFTTPPCTEEVQWTVMAKHVTLGAAQIKTFTDLYSDNFRPIQGTLN
ncbi:MAG: carbonic anhydrase family protein [Gammaproteobacteria bacterium]|nr:carbonic anhydrase family protein [Gammaproteobacteria bacterium]